MFMLKISLIATGVALALVLVGIVAAYHSNPPLEFDPALASEPALLNIVYATDTIADVAWAKPEDATLLTRYHLELVGFLPDVDYVPVKMATALHTRGSKQMRFGKLSPATTYQVCLSTGTPLMSPFGSPECTSFVTDPLYSGHD